MIDTKDARKKYNTQKNNAKSRNIEFCITFEEWLKIWETSGKWHLRGRGADKYCMCRIGDTGSYCVENVFIGQGKQNVRDGHVWTYNSRTAFGRLFPYLTQSQIKTAISKLVDTGLLLKGEYNVANYDKTNWYSPSISAKWLENPIGYKSPMDWSETANGLVENRQPIPVSKPDIKPDTLFGEKSPKQQTIKRSISLPDGWVPSNQNIEDAMKRGFSTEETNNEAEQFRNYHQSKGSAFKDWDAAWRTWLGNAKKFARSRPARNGGGHNALMAGFASYAAQLED